MSDFEKAMNELHEDNIISIGETPEQIEEMLNEMDPMISVCEDIISLYMSRAKTAIHAQAMEKRMQAVELPTRLAFNNAMLLKGNNEKTSCQISDQGAKSSGTFCSCKDFHFQQWNGGEPCKHLAKLAHHYINK